MEIITNTDTRIENTVDLRERVSQVLRQELKHVSDSITRIEAHLRDVNSDRGGATDRKCLLEARVSGLQPIVAEHRATDIGLALTGAAKQLARAVRSAQGKAGGNGSRSDAHKRIDPTPEDV